MRLRIHLTRVRFLSQRGTPTAEVIVASFFEDLSLKMLFIGWPLMGPKTVVATKAAEDDRSAMICVGDFSANLMPVD